MTWPGLELDGAKGSGSAEKASEDENRNYSRYGVSRAGRRKAVNYF